MFRRATSCYSGALALIAIAGAVHELIPARGGPLERVVERTLLTTDSEIVRRAWQLRFSRSASDPAALEWARREVLRNPASPYAWADLAEFLWAAGARAQASRFMARAARQGPCLPVVLMRAANLAFLAGEPSLALSHAVRILDLVEEFDEVVFSSFDRMALGPERILARGVLDHGRGAREYFRHLMRHGSPEIAARGWQALSALGLADGVLADEYAAQLVRSGAGEAAVEVWLPWAVSRDPDYRRRSLLSDGGFESELAGGCFDWNVASVAGASVSRTASGGGPGQWSLHIHFDGTNNVFFAHVWQQVVVRPGSYRLEARVRTSGLETDRGVQLRATDALRPGRLDARTAPRADTTPWSAVGRTFQVPPGTRLINVQIFREASVSFDRKLRGDVWVDDVVLARVGGSYAR